MSGERTLKEDLARYLDPAAFRTGVPESVKGTCPTHGKTIHDRLKTRREIAMKRAESAIRFFRKPGSIERLPPLTEPKP